VIARNGGAPAAAAADSEMMSGVHPAASEFSFPMSGMTSPTYNHVPTYLDLFLAFSETIPVRIL